MMQTETALSTETTFTYLVDAYHSSMVRLATRYVHDRAIAEEVAQDAWIGVLRALHQFAGRSSLKTWIFRILINLAKHRAQREARSVAMAELPEVSDTRTPESHLLSAELRARVRSAIGALPPGQAGVVLMRDVQGYTAAEVCQALNVSEANQRVLLHRGRCSVRAALADCRP